MREWLVKTGMTQTELARGVRRSDPTVSCWLSGKNLPDVVSAGLLEGFTGRAVPALAWSKPYRKRRVA